MIYPKKLPSLVVALVVLAVTVPSQGTRDGPTSL